MEELEDAIDYFENFGFIDELTSDKKYYVEILIKFAKMNKDGKKQNVDQIKTTD